MSALPFATGKREIRACECGVQVEAVENGLMGQEGTFWFIPKHEAPCGLPCWKGGVRPQVYRSGEYHRPDGRCPRCSPEVANPRETWGPKKLARHVIPDSE